MNDHNKRDKTLLLLILLAVALICWVMCGCQRTKAARCPWAALWHDMPARQPMP